MKFFLPWQTLRSPEGDEHFEGGNLSADVDLLGTEETETEDNDSVEELEDSDDSSSEDGEITEESSEENKDENKEVEEDKQPFLVHDRPTVTELKTAYPDFFKKFPSMKDVIFREQEYAKLYPTVDMAKAAAENSSAMETFQEELSKGNVESFVQALVEIKAVDKVAPNLLSSLYKVSPEAYTSAVTPAFEKAVKLMYSEGLNSKNENLANAALVMSKWLFDDFEIAKGGKTLVKQEDPELIRMREERDQELNQTYIRNHTEVSKVSVDRLKEIITDKLDPENVLSGYLKNTITKDVLDEVTSQMAEDKTYINYMNSLWNEYKRKGYPGELKDRIISSFLSRAKPLIPGIRARIRKEALGVAVRNSKDKGSRSEKSGTKQVSQGGNSKESRPFNSNKAVDYSRTSDEDLLNDKITYRN